MRRIIVCIAAVSMALLAMATEKNLTVKIANPADWAKKNVGVEVPLSAVPFHVSAALVTVNGAEVPCQLDDLDDDGCFDELFFLVDLKANETLSASVSLSSEGEPRQYAARTFAALNIRDRKEKNPKHIAIRSLTVPTQTNPYQYIFPHGGIIESEQAAFRIYFDHRQSVDYYAKRKEQLEVEQSWFYPNAEQKAAGFGDDVLFTGDTFGCGALFGWDGKQPVMFESARNRTQTVLSTGPLRSMLEVKNKGWRVTPQSEPVDITTRYILMAGHRDVKVAVSFSRNVSDLLFSTGTVNVKTSTAFSDNDGLRACWGTACSGKNPETAPMQTVGLAVCIPKSFYVCDESATDTYYPDVVRADVDTLHYYLTAACDIESFGFHSDKAWFDYLKTWKRDLEEVPVITIEGLTK